jgi:hypothetical protein
MVPIVRTILAVVAAALAPSATADVYVANQSGPSVTVYAPSAIGNASPARTIAGAATALNFPESVTVDAVNNELYVADFFGQAIRVYPLNATGNVAPIRTLIDGPNSGLLQPRMAAVDTVNNEILVPSINDSIRVYPRTANGDVAPIRVITGANTRVNNPISISLDLTNNEIAVDSYDVGGPNVPGILTFSRTANGNVAPLRQITGGATLLGTFTNYVVVDPVNNEIYAQANTGAGYAVFSRIATGNVAPLRNVTGAATCIQQMGGILVDLPNQRVLVTDENNNLLLAFARLANGNAGPVAVVAGSLTGLRSPFGLAMDTLGGLTGVGGQCSTPPVPTLADGTVLLLAGLMVVSGFCLVRRKNRRPS